MKLKAVVELSDQEYDSYNDILRNLREKIGTNFDHGLVYDPRPRPVRYACSCYAGVIKPETIQALGRMPTELEVSMMCDRGFSHFGGSCVVNEATGHFDCTIYVD